MENVFINDSKKERVLILILSLIQFVHILDYVIMMPLGPQFIRTFHITPAQFGWLVSSYTFSASIFGLIGAFFIDRFDRKTALVFLLMGFTVGTVFCALAPNYQFFLFARIFSGAFGGVMGAMIFSIIGDQIPPERRGTATGMVMSSFSVASVAGVPIGLYLSTNYGWHTPFSVLTLVSIVIVLLAMKNLDNMTNHLKNFDQNQMFKKITDIVSDKNHLKAFALSIMLTMAGFSVIPYLSPYMVFNVGLSESDLPMIYFTGGICTLFTSRIIGKLSDKYGKLKMFTIIASLATIPLLAVTNLPKMPLYLVLSVTCVFMIFVSGRFIPATAMITGSVKPQNRGSFMSLNSSVQNMGSGLAAFISGSIIYQAPTGHLINYNLVGWFSVASSFICIALARSLKFEEGKLNNKDVKEEKPAEVLS